VPAVTETGTRSDRSGGIGARIDPVVTTRTVPYTAATRRSEVCRTTAGDNSCRRITHRAKASIATTSACSDFMVMSATNRSRMPANASSGSSNSVAYALRVCSEKNDEVPEAVPTPPTLTSKPTGATGLGRYAFPSGPRSMRISLP
jgi:hypothetical protein